MAASSATFSDEMKPSITSTVFLLLFAASASVLHAQLRPLEPSQWRLYEDSTIVRAELGGSRLWNQRASLAGEEGDLWEAGNFSLAWRTGRVILEAAGTAQRYFRETSRFDAPYPYVDPSTNGRRHDSGDYRVSTTVRLTPASFPFDGHVRFGTRLPTTDNTTGLDRDAVDFFATIGGSHARGPVAVAAEAGLGIHSTREPRFEQDDLFLYSVSAELRSWKLIPSVMALGQMHGTTHSAIRGVENLGEVRAGLRAGNRNWMRVDFVKGYETFSPSSGVILTFGMAR
jgi:hypothetical protein